jgi:colicin import membrane protein
MTEERKSILKSFGLHAAIACVLLLSVAFGEVTMPELSQPNPVIQATFIDAQAIYDQQQEEQAAAQAAQQEIERQREAKRKAEAERKRKAEAAKERKRQRELERKAREAAEKKRQREAQEKAEREKQQREKAEREQKRKEQQALDQLMQEQMRAEKAAQAQRRSQQVLSEVDKYRALITQSIQRYLIDDGSFRGKRCRLNIRLASTGLVTSVSVLSGDDALCRASRSAVLRPDKMPMSNDLDVYQELKDITLTVEL